jgi:drug/metabolite transporter (DMT)-like permease
MIQGLLLTKKKYRKELPSVKQFKYAFLLGSVMLLNTFTFYYAYQNTTIANAVLTHYTAPIIVAFLAPFLLKEALTARIISEIILGSAGLFIMLDGFSLEQGQMKGVLSGLFSGVAYALVILLLRLYSSRFHVLVLCFLTNLTVALLLLPVVSAFPIDAAWSFLVMGVLHSTVAPVLYYQGLKYVQANKAAVLGYLEPVCAICLAMVFLNETPGVNTLIGGTLILFSGYLTLKKQ